MDRYLRVITHLHSDASNDRASTLYPYITDLVESVLGTVPPAIAWSECFTTADDLRDIVENRRTQQPVDLVFLTDHVNLAAHRLPDKVGGLAAQCPRFGVGAEIATFMRRCDGSWVPAPEVLVYGSKRPIVSAQGPYWGLSNEILAAIFDECTAAAAPGPEIFAVLRFCRRQGLAHALAHPFDGHLLTLPETLTVMRSCHFIETINGGYSPRSAHALEMYTGFHNRVVSGAADTMARAGKLSPFQRIQCQQIRKCGHPLLMLGGSDAHAADFDRVVTYLRADEDRTDAGQFIHAMLQAEQQPDAWMSRFVPHGQAMGRLALYREVTPLVVRNLLENRDSFRSLATLARGFWSGLRGMSRQLSSLMAANQQLLRDFEDLLAIPRMLNRMEGADRTHAWTLHPAFGGPITHRM